MIKKILPIEIVTYRFSLNKTELIAQLHDQIELEKAFGFGAHRQMYAKPYIGKIFPDGFEIKRAINYKNSFLPIIKGEIKEDMRGTKIAVTMGLLTFVKIFMIIWFSSVLLACVVLIYTLLFTEVDNSESTIFMFIPLFMLVFGIALVSLGFKTESKKSIKDLEEILMAKRVENENK